MEFLTPKQRRLLEYYAYARPLWLGLALGGAVASLLRAIDHGSSPPVEDVARLRERGDVLLGFPELEAAVYAYGRASDAYRVSRAKASPESVRQADRYGLAQDRRLAPTYLRGGPDLPKVAYDGFVWCAASPTDVPDDGRPLSDARLFRVTLKDARGLYVADHGALVNKRAEIAREGLGDFFSEEEVSAFLRARASTIVPIDEYDGTFEAPVYLVGRELELDEVEIVLSAWQQEAAT